MPHHLVCGDAWRVCLFEDSRVGDLEPLSLTRPAFDLFCGATSLADKQCRLFGISNVGALVRPYLADLCRLRRPGWPVNDATWLRARPTILVNGRWLPTPEIVDVSPFPSVGLLGEEIGYAVLGPEHLARCSFETLNECLEDWRSTLPCRFAGGHLLRHGWDLVEHNPEQLRFDAQHFPSRPIDAGLTVIGPLEHLHIDPTARIEPLVLLDTTHGPVMIDGDAVVKAFSRIEGPCYIGPGSQIHGARLRGGVTIGPDCRIGGEVEASIVHGLSNKAHDGFLGHSYVGEWVNLGAGTQNSDLRNDYGEVAVTIAGRRVATGMTKVGCLLGDHTKTGLGTLLNTGTNAGAFCNLLPGGLLPRYMPSFCSWWNASLADNADLPALLETASKVMGRRGQELSEAHAAVYRRLFEQGTAERRRILRDAEMRRLRRSA